MEKVNYYYDARDERSLQSAAPLAYDPVVLSYQHSGVSSTNYYLTQVFEVPLQMQLTFLVVYQAK